MLARAFVDVLRAHGHEATHLTHGVTPCSLLIHSEGTRTERAAGGATLILRRSPDRPADPDPAFALRRALDRAGTAVWRSPLDVRLLLDVLAQDASAPLDAGPTAEVAAPDLARSPHAWLVLDVVHGLVLAASTEARMVLDLPEHGAGAAVADLPIAGALRETIQEESEGLRAGEVAGFATTAAWWTDADGHRVVCFLEAPALQSQAARNRQALAALGQMAATLAHEIRNPVASLGMARDRLKQLSRLLEKTLSLARPISGAPEEIDLDPVIASAVSTLTLDPRFHGIAMDVTNADGSLTVMALEGPLLQALTNVLLNAAQAQDGEGHVRIDVSRDSRRALVRIHDEGPGIDPEKQQDIFKPFYTTKPAGTGLGLAEVRRAMEAMGGGVVVESVERGACFRLEIPLAR